ncbi:UDP-glucosyl transferase family protein [Neofusicoccum parvum]|nr:UDP-glucosyl transferase family protein [Neofusicoccum parvum]
MATSYVWPYDEADKAIVFRPPGYSGTNCSFLASHYFDPNATFTVDPNPDIAGIGVILAFLISAYATLLFTICAYWTGLVPDELLNAVDKRFFGAKSERRPGWSEAFQEGIRAFSDQQIITGIAVLAAAFAGFETVSVYHWRTVVYLAWMSSNVHLTTLTVLRRLLQANTAARALRLTGMLVLFVLLVAALVPTASDSFGNAGSNVPYAGSWYLRPLAFTPADPAACFWQRRYMDGPTMDSVISFAMLTSSYVWKVTGLFGRSHKLAREFLRNRPARAVPPLIRRAALWRSRSRRVVYWLTAWPYSLVVGLYVLYMAVFDFMDSFAASILVLTISLVWGTLNLVLPRAFMSKWVGSDEGEWNFGQYLPVMLLLLPVMSIIEEFSVSVTVIDVPSPEQQQHDRLYASRFFKSLVWVTNLCIILAAIFVLFMRYLALVNGSMNNQVVIYVGVSIAAVCFLLFVWIAFGALFSKVSL